MNSNRKKMLFCAPLIGLILGFLWINANVCFPYQDLKMYDLSTWRPTGNHLEALEPFHVSGIVVDNHANVSVVAVVEGQFVTLRAGGRDLTSKACFPKGFGF